MNRTTSRSVFQALAVDGRRSRRRTLLANAAVVLSFVYPKASVPASFVGSTFTAAERRLVAAGAIACGTRVLMSSTLRTPSDLAAVAAVAPTTHEAMTVPHRSARDAVMFGKSLSGFPIKVKTSPCIPASMARFALMFPCHTFGSSVCVMSSAPLFA
eukprot:CAMPEP_0206130656 /NCGR_PEP_ID=MMETSP1472-20131121/41988_1 /ASSEMBLY_ACC=CAM_ASM_001108 /TAXON_ID=41880 /ORGANISM="Pycnococcus provasolii, Strain RCC251" /LENGTH=156 /DNA_ID=CAMNT_0053522025 /DNA_START=65 /DNA_END=535 /DNA_ORIENTATION=+